MHKMEYKIWNTRKIKSIKSLNVRNYKKLGLSLIILLWSNSISNTTLQLRVNLPAVTPFFSLSNQIQNKIIQIL